MTPPEPDRALRRLIAKLAELKDADRQAVLKSLSREQAQEVAKLIGVYRGEADDHLPSKTDGPWSGLGLSPVLRQRLEGEISDLRMPSAGGDRRGALTPLTLDTLRRLARDLEPLPPPPPTTTAPEISPSFWRKLGFPRRPA